MVTVNQEACVAARTAFLALSPYIDCSELTVTPIKAPFTPSKTLDLATLVVADFTGSTPKNGDAVAAVKFTDPVDGKQKIRFPEPLGGWNWITTGVTNLPQTIYGVKLEGDGGNQVGCVRLAADVILTATAQSFGVGDLIINLEDINLSGGVIA